MKLILMIVLIGMSAVADANTYINNYIDTALTSIAAEINKIEPIPISDLSTTFSKKVGFVTVSGTAKLTNGKLNKLGTVRRIGDCTTAIINNEFTVTCKLGFSPLRAKYSAKATFLKVSATTVCKAKAKGVRVMISFKPDLLRGTATLHDFSISKIGSLSASFTDYGPLEWITSIISSKVADKYKDTIIKALEDPVKDLLSKEIAKMNFSAP